MPTITSQPLSVRYLLHEECFPFLEVSRKAFFQRLFDSLSYLILLLLFVYLCLFFGKLCLSP
jgi:hypothetical protein